jgi:hypothetical protein
MRTVRWIAAVLSLLPALQSMAAADATQGNCGLKQYGSTELRFYPDTPVFARVTIGTVPALMILEIGNGAAFIWADSASRLQLKPRLFGDSGVLHYGDKPVTHFVQVEQFQIGDVRFGKTKFLLTDVSQQSEVDGLPVIGSIGLDMFANADFELNLAARKLNVFSHDHCKGRVVYWSNSYDSVPVQRGLLGNISFPMEMDGKKIDTTFTTSIAESSIHTDITERYFGFNEKSEGITTEVGSQGHSASHFRAMALTANGLQVLNAKVRLIESGDSRCAPRLQKGVAVYGDCHGIYPMRLGRAVLLQLRIYVATKEGVMYFTAADPAQVQSPAKAPASAPPPIN